MAGRRCPGQRCPTILTGAERYCPTHAREYEARRGTPRQRGYGAEHKALRADWQRRINDGEIVMCADGCGQRITGRIWHLGHTEDRSAYLGPQTVQCNTEDGGRRGARARHE